MTDYMIPAARIFRSAAHIRDPAVLARREPAYDSRIRDGQPTSLTPDSHDGQTICGVVMHVAEQWTVYLPDPKWCPICPDCQAGTAAYVQEALL